MGFMNAILDIYAFFSPPSSHIRATLAWDKVWEISGATSGIVLRVALMTCDV